jgi:uncharacterized protein YkwD
MLQMLSQQKFRGNSNNNRNNNNNNDDDDDDNNQNNNGPSPQQMFQMFGPNGGRRGGPASAPRDDRVTGNKANIFNALNQLRSQNGRQPVKYSNCLDQIAQAHADDMVRRNFFSHTNPDGQGIPERIDAGVSRYAPCKGSNFMGNAENIAYGGGWQTAMSMWKNSPGHFTNEVGPYNQVGVGISKQKYVQVFGNV